MPKESCPAIVFCEKDVEEISNAFAMETIIKTKGMSPREGWNTFRKNEKKLQGVGIIVKEGRGRCSDCPIAVYVKDENDKLRNKGLGHLLPPDAP